MVLSLFGEKVPASLGAARGWGTPSGQAEGVLVGMPGKLSTVKPYGGALRPKGLMHTNQREGGAILPRGTNGCKGTIGPFCHSSVIALSQLVSVDLSTLHTSRRAIHAQSAGCAA